MSDKMTTEQVDLRRPDTTDVIRAEELIARRNAFVNNGFSLKWISALELQRPTLYSLLVLESHIQGLRERGFTNPNKMIESLPPILGLAFENIDRRLRLLDKLIKLYNLPFSGTHLMEQESFLFSTKIDKILVLVRVLREYKVRHYELTDKVIKRLLRANLEDTLIALDSPSDPNEKIEDLIRRTRSVNRQKLPKEEKRKIIKEGLLEFEKIKQRYFRGYPESIKQ